MEERKIIVEDAGSDYRDPPQNRFYNSVLQPVKSEVEESAKSSSLKHSPTFKFGSREIGSTTSQKSKRKLE
jgi:hypothetical protein